MNEKKTVSTGVLVKSSFWYTISNFLTKAMVFITAPIFARVLTNEEYGNFTVFSSWQAIFLIICGLEVYGTINRTRFDYEDENEFNSYISSSLVLSTACTGIFFILFLIFPSLFYKVFLMEKKYIFFMFAYLFAYPALGMFQAKQRVEYKYKISAGISFFLVIASSLTALFLALTMKNERLFGRVVGQFSLYIIAGFAFYIYFLKKNHTISLSKCKYALRLGVPLVFSYLGSQIMLSSDNLVLKHMCTGKEVSYLSVTHTCTHIVLFLVQTLNAAWAPYFFDKLNVKDYKEIRKLYAIYIWLIVFLTFGILLFAPEMIAFFGGARYKEAIYLLPANILCGVFTALISQFTNFETFHKKPEYAAILTGGLAVLNIGLDIIGVKLFGYAAVCYATVICQVILVLLHYAITRKLGIKEVLPLKMLLPIIGTVIVLIPVSFLLYVNNIVRYSIIGVLVIGVLTVFYLKKNEILALVKKIRKK